MEGMRYAALTRRLDVDSSHVWEIHYHARRRLDAGEDVILLGVGDPDFDTPPAIVEAAERSLRRGRTRYAATAGDLPLREAIARHHERLTAQRVDAEQVVVFTGAQNALFASVLCVVDPGEEIIVCEPRYVTYDGVIETPGAVRVGVPLVSEEGFRFDPDAIGRAVTPRTRAILLNSPHNPTGRVLSREEAAAVSAIAKRHDLWVISDEVYASLTYDVEHVAIASLPGMAGRSRDHQLALQVARDAGMAPRLDGGAGAARAPLGQPYPVDGLRRGAVHPGRGPLRPHPGVRGARRDAAGVPGAPGPPLREE